MITATAAGEQRHICGLSCILYSLTGQQLNNKFCRIWQIASCHRHACIALVHLLEPTVLLYLCLGAVHLKMMRLLFLCLLLPAAMASSEESEGSAGDDTDDEDLVRGAVIPNRAEPEPGSVDKTTAVEESPDQLTLIVIIAAVSVVALSVAAIVAAVLVRRRMQNRQPGMYSAPEEQNQKGAV